MLEHDIVLLMLLIVGGISALGANSHGIDGTSLKSALNAINRKQRFYKYYGDDLNEKKFQRNRRATGHDIEDEDDDIEFLPIESQLDTARNNQFLERDFLDYLEKSSEPGGNAVSSIFRERQRNSNRKRGINIEDKQLLKYFLEGLQHDRSTAGDTKTNDHLRENVGSMSWGEQGSNDGGDREENILYVLPTERRNVNGRYPLGRDHFRNYENYMKRFPVAKRSPKLPETTKPPQTTDPKVAKNLEALFGVAEPHRDNHTTVADERHHQTTKTMKNDNATETTRAKDSIRVKKKNIDWSQYFGIDRRRKKASFLAGPDTQHQDDEWLVQRYYKTMAEQLKPTYGESEEENEEQEEKLDRMNTKLRNFKDLILQEALRNTGSEEGIDRQEIKDKVWARLAAAYSSDKIQKALNELRENIAAQKAFQHALNNLTNDRQDNKSENHEGKRNYISLAEARLADDNDCPELDSIERRCIVEGYETEILHLPCVMLQICKTCGQEELDDCLGTYAIEAAKICDNQNTKEGLKDRETCASTALILSQIQPPNSAILLCTRSNANHCLRRYHHRYRQRYLPYNDERYHDYDTLTEDERLSWPLTLDR